MRVGRTMRTVTTVAGGLLGVVSMAGCSPGSVLGTSYPAPRTVSPLGGDGGASSAANVDLAGKVSQPSVPSPSPSPSPSRGGAGIPDAGASSPSASALTAAPVPGSGAVPGAGTVPASTSASGTASSGSTRPQVLVAVSTTGALVVLDPDSGAVVRTLVAAGVTGSVVSLAGRGGLVYFERPFGCHHQVWRVAVTGGAPALVAATGSVPAVSPDGTRLAFARQTFGCPDSARTAGAASSVTSDRFLVVVRDLRSGQERDYSAPSDRPEGFEMPIVRLSWSGDGARLVESFDPVVRTGSDDVPVPPEDSAPGQVAVLDLAQDLYYLADDSPRSPQNLPETDSARFAREAAFLPDGRLLVVRGRRGVEIPVGAQVRVAPRIVPGVRDLLEEVDPGSGVVVRRVAAGAVGLLLGAPATDVTGRWLLFVSGTEVRVVHGDAHAVHLVGGYLAADW